ncbi:hypothetical protein ACSBR1_020914 [Camellia fascicularis]
MAGKPAVVTRVVDSMTGNLRPTRAEATDVANAVLDGSDAILLGAETLRGLYPVQAISIVGKICAEIDNVGMDTVMFLGQIDDVCMGAIYIIFFVYRKHVQLICFVIKFFQQLV